MNESEILSPISDKVEYTSSYVMPEIYITTSAAILYRVRKAGKYFIIKTAKDKSGQSLALLQREYELSLGKSHPHIVNIFTYEKDTVVGEGIVMEYIDGRTLTAFLAENPSPAMRKRVFEQLLQAVGYIHRCGLVHNDIKPGNILVTRSNNDVKLIDFGLADNDAWYLARTLGCTRAYASPELLSQKQNVDARSDIYSLGVIMKEIFGRRYSRIARRCLSDNPAKRYSNAEELLTAIKNKNNLLYMALSVVAAILISIPLLYIGKRVSEEMQYANKEKELLLQIERDVDALYAVTADSLSRAVYYEFASNNILHFWNSLARYNEEKIQTITPYNLRNTASLYYSQKLSDCNKQLWSIAESLPLYVKSNLSIEEIVFYNSLIEKRLPYEQYKK